MAALDIKPQDIAGLPRGIENWHVETGSDATGDPAIWVWISVQDEMLDQMDTAKREEIRDIVSSEIQKKLVGSYGTSIPWVYVRFRGASESGG